jgi:hypothetical protein
MIGTCMLGTSIGPSHQQRIGHTLMLVLKVRYYTSIPKIQHR